MRPWLFCILVGAGLLGPSESATAQHVEGKFLLGMELSLFSISMTTISPVNTGGLLAGPVTNIDIVTLGPLGRSSVVFGYGLTDHWTLRASLGATRVSTEIDVDGPTPDSETTLTQYTVNPMIEYMFGRSRARFFLGAGPTLNISPVDQSGRATTQTTLGILATVGARVFLTPSVSLDPSLIGAYVDGGAEDDRNTIEMDVHAFSFAMLVGLSAWL